MGHATPHPFNPPQRGGGIPHLGKDGNKVWSATSKVVKTVRKAQQADKIHETAAATR